MPLHAVWQKANPLQRVVANRHNNYAYAFVICVSIANATAVSALCGSLL